MSNEKVVSDSTRASLPMSRLAAMPQVKLHSPRWRTITPLGWPVEPEV